MTDVAVHPRTRRPPARAAARAALRNDVVIAGIALLAAYDLALAVFMAAWPHAFYVHVGPFGLRNDHYIRDTATFNAAVGVGLALALRRPSWRVPMLAITTLQFALHSINHLVDIDKAYPAWNGYFDFFSLAVATIAIAGLLRVARGDAGVGAGRSWKGANR